MAGSPQPAAGEGSTNSPFVYRATRTGIPVETHPPEPPKKKGSPVPWILVAAVVVAAAGTYFVLRKPESLAESTPPPPSPRQESLPPPQTPPAQASSPSPRESTAAVRATAEALIDSARRLSEGRSSPELALALIQASNAKTHELAGSWEDATRDWSAAAQTAGSLAASLGAKALEARLAQIPIRNARDFQPDAWRTVDAPAAAAAQAVRAGDYATAVRRYEEAAAALPTVLTRVAEQIQSLARSAEAQGDRESALLFYLQHHQLRPQDPDTLTYLHRNRYKPGEVFISPSGIRFAWIPPGEFIQGSPEDEPGRDPDETQRRVIITRGFFMGITEVTQRQWDFVMPPEKRTAQLLAGSPANFRGPDLPIHSMTFEDALLFCQLLSERDGRPYRLPTEAEWEYAARAGTTAAFASGVSLSAESANVDDGSNRSRMAPIPVQTLGSPNAFGLWDIHGNIWEWCSDWYGPYEPGPITDPTGIPDAAAGRPDLAMRSVRGGSWFHSATWARSANRWGYSPVVAVNYIGFRLVAPVERFPAN